MTFNTQYALEVSMSRISGGPRGRKVITVMKRGNVVSNV